MNLARALAAEPDLILCDEVTSALDTVVGAAILDLHGPAAAGARRVAYMFISHDLNTVRAVCDDIVVLYAGQKVEAVSRVGVQPAPRHPYFHLLATVGARAAARLAGRGGRGAPHGRLRW